MVQEVAARKRKEGSSTQRRHLAAAFGFAEALDGAGVGFCVPERLPNTEATVIDSSHCKHGEKCEECGSTSGGGLG